MAEFAGPNHSPVEAREALGGVGEVDARTASPGASPYEQSTAAPALGTNPSGLPAVREPDEAALTERESVTEDSQHRGPSMPGCKGDSRSVSVREPDEATIRAAREWLADFAGTPPSEWAYHASVVLNELDRLVADRDGSKRYSYIYGKAWGECMEQRDQWQTRAENAIAEVAVLTARLEAQPFIGGASLINERAEKAEAELRALTARLTEADEAKPMLREYVESASELVGLVLGLTSENPGRWEVGKALTACDRVNRLTPRARAALAGERGASDAT